MRKSVHETFLCLVLKFAKCCSTGIFLERINMLNLNIILKAIFSVSIFKIKKTVALPINKNEKRNINRLNNPV